ncbi:MAG TPA: exodeoxyribonuclease VII small subunit [Candidatus Pacebacteria bacterium]|nr:exodeoxyribonuclease VII small subunit [Candidatus Paceibacterota bacterium]
MTNPKTTQPTLNTAFNELEKIVAQFEHDEIDLEQSLPKFKRGLELAQFLKTRLGELENEIKTVKAEFETTTSKTNSKSAVSETSANISDELPF